MDVLSFFLYLLIMAGVTYLIRAVPFVMFKKKIENRYVSAFLAYIPYAVLASMTVPAILYSTSAFITALCGFIVATLLSYFEKSLIVVALAASATVFVCQLILNML